MKNQRRVNQLFKLFGIPFVLRHITLKDPHQI
jgi:hypothetical protein